MRIAAFPAGEFHTNCYIVSSDNGSECIVIDPGQDAFSRVKQIVKQNDLQPKAIYLTHGHADHIWNSPQVSYEYNIPVFAAQADHFMIIDPSAGIGPHLAQLFFKKEWELPADLRNYPANKFMVAGLFIRVLPLPGHTPGSVGLLVKDQAATTSSTPQPLVLFSGDTLFKGAVGRTDLPKGDSQQLLHSIETEIIPLPDEVVVAPGHGATSSIKEERTNNIYLARFRHRGTNR